MYIIVQAKNKMCLLKELLLTLTHNLFALAKFLVIRFCSS